MICPRWKLFPPVLLFLFASISLVPTQGSRLDFHSANKNGLLRESELIMRSLESAVKFLAETPDSVTGDVVLGIFLTSASLRWLHRRLKEKSIDGRWPDERLESLLTQCRRIVAATTESKDLALLNETLWEDSARDLQFGRLEQRDYGLLVPEFDSCRTIDEYMMRGTPEDSDFCINELVTSGCQVSDSCFLSESNGLPHSGYKTTHRLLYFQVAFRMKCQQSNPQKFADIGQRKRDLCRRILQEASTLSQRPATLPWTRDLFMEQIALCGLEGHREFAPPDWRLRVRGWQDSRGCFPSDPHASRCVPRDDDRSSRATKRRDTEVEGCRTHVTAVALSALAFFLRVTLTAAFALP